MCRYRFLQAVFPSVPDWRCYDLSQLAKEVYFKRAETIFKMGAHADVFYLVMEGSVRLETLIETGSYTKIPVAGDQWEVNKRAKTIKYRLKDIKPGELLGCEEIFERQAERKSIATAIQDAKLIFFRPSVIQEYHLPEKEIRASLLVLDVERIANQIQSQVKKVGNISQTLDLATRPSGNTVTRLRPWITQAKQKVTRNPAIRSQLSRVGVVKVSS